MKKLELKWGPKLRHLDLFSGIGGFALAASWVWGEQYEPVAFCEIEPYCQKILNKHWPNVPIHENIKNLDVDNVGNIELITGGFPCQDLSIANQKGKGLQGERSSLWWEMHRIIHQVMPRFVIVENVPNFFHRGFGNFLRSLAEIGYNAEWDCISAFEVGAPHKRERLWIIAYSSSLGCLNVIQKAESIIDCESLQQSQPWQSNFILDDCARYSYLGNNQSNRVDYGFPERLDEVRALGNAIVPQVAMVIMQAIKQVNEEIGQPVAGKVG